MHTRYVKRSLEPPEGLHVHIVGEGLIRHRSTEDSHRRATDSTAGEDDAVHMMLGNLLSHLDTFFYIRTMPAVIPHISLDDDCHIVTGMRHNLIEHLIEEPYAILKRTSVLVMPMVGTRADELGDEVCVSGMYLDTVEATLACPIDSFAELLNHIVYLIDFEATMDSRAIEVEPCIGADRHTVACIEMRHIAAVTELDRRFRALRMDSVGQFLHIRNDIRADV